MRNITVADTLDLPIPERIQLVGEIWDSIAAQVEVPDLTCKEKQIIDERLEAHRRSPEAGSSWNDVYNRITAQYGI